MREWYAFWSMNVSGGWLASAAVAALVLTSCGGAREPGEGARNGAGAGGEDSTGAAGQAGADVGAAGNAGSGSGGANSCDSGCEAAGASSGGVGGSPAEDAGAGSGAEAGSGGTDAGSLSEPARVSYLTTVSSFVDETWFVFTSLAVADPAPDRSLFVVVQSASNGVTVAERVLVNGVEAAKLVAVGEDVQPSAPSALFAIPFPSGTQAAVEVEMSSTVVRCAVSLLVAYGLHNTAGVDDSETLVTKTSGSMTLDVAAGGSVITALAMATNSLSPTAELPGFEGTGHSEVLQEGTPTLILVGASNSRSAGPATVDVLASDPMFNFRALSAAVH